MGKRWGGIVLWLRECWPAAMFVLQLAILVQTYVDALVLSVLGALSRMGPQGVRGLQSILDLLIDGQLRKLEGNIWRELTKNSNREQVKRR